MPLEFGIYVNNRATVFLGEAYPLERLLEAAVLTEDVGLDFVSVGDSVLASPRHSAIPVLAAIAARTRRVKLATGILRTHMRNPVLLAQEWATLDVLSDGRTILGAGLGGGTAEMVAREYELLGIPRARRGKAFDESVQLLKRLWTEDRVTFEGSVLRCRDVSIGYRPVQRPHPPIWMSAGVPEQTAGGSEVPLDRVARLADGWLTAVASPDEFGRTLERIRSMASERYQRTLGPEFRGVFECFINVGKTTEQSRQEALEFHQRYHRSLFDEGTIERWVVYGRPEEVAARLAQYVAVGANSFHLVPAGPDIPAQIQAIAAELKPLLP